MDFHFGSPRTKNIWDLHNENPQTYTCIVYYMQNQLFTFSIPIHKCMFIGEIQKLLDSSRKKMLKFAITLYRHKIHIHPEFPGPDIKSIPNFPARTSNHQPKAQLHHSQEVAGSCRPPWRIAVATLHALFSERRKVGLVCGLGFPLPRLRCFFWMIGEGKRWICFPPGHIPIVGKKNIKFPVLRFSQELSNKGWGMF